MSLPSTRPPERRPPAASPRVTRVQSVEPPSAWRGGTREISRRLAVQGELRRDQPSHGSGTDADEAAWQLDAAAPAGVRRPAAIVQASPGVQETAARELSAMLVGLLEHLAQFCAAPPVADRGRWTMLFPLAFPGIEKTRLRAEVSPTEVRLRFETEHVPSRCLLAECVPAVEHVLGCLLADHRTIEVALW